MINLKTGKMKRKFNVILFLLISFNLFSQTDRRPLNDSVRYFETHDAAVNGDGVAVINSNRNIYYVPGNVHLTLYQNKNNIYGLIDSSLYIADNTNLTIGNDTILLIASHDSIINDTFKVIIKVKDADNCYFVNPNGGSGTGTYLNPNNILPTLSANTTYLIYRGSELNRGSTTITIAGLDSITFSSYGSFSGGNYGAITITDNNIFRIYNSNNITVRDLELSTSEPTRSNPTHIPPLDSNIYYYTDWGALAYLNNYLGVSDSCVFENNYIHSIYTGAFLGDDPPQWSTMSHDFEFRWNRCDSMPDEGIFIKNIKGKINVVGNWWTNINLLYNYFPTDQQNADGDILQTYNQDSTKISNNLFDKSTTGQKFNAILDQISTVPISSGTLEAGGRYRIYATETDHFYAGCQIGDIFIANGTETCDANNQVQVYLNSPVIFKDNYSIAGANYHHIYRYCENFVCEGNIFYSKYGIGQLEDNSDGYGVDGIYVGGGDDVNIYSYNVFINSRFAIWDQNAIAYNNIFYNTEHSFAGFGGWNQTLRNNAFILSSGQEVYDNVSVNSDYNLFTSEFTDMFGTGRSTLASVSYESHSIIGTTGFFGDTTNWKTGTSSDLVDAGYEIGLTRDLYYNQVGGFPDIGVFESNYIASDTVTCDSTELIPDSIIYSNDWQNWSYNQPITDSAEWIGVTPVVPRIDTTPGGVDFVVTHTVGAGHQFAILDTVLNNDQGASFTKQFNSGNYTGAGLRMSGTGATLQGYILRTNNSATYGVQLLNMFEGAIIDTIDEVPLVANGSNVTYEIRDSSITVYDDGLPIIDTFDTDYTSGYAGIYAYGTYQGIYNQLDDFVVINIGTPSLPIIKIYGDVTNETNGDGTGSIDITPYCGTSPYTYEWSNTETTQDISSLSEGSYWVKATDNNGISSDTTYFNVGNVISSPSQSNKRIIIFGGMQNDKIILIK